MKALIVDECTAERLLRISEVPEPMCGPQEVVVAVKCAGVNRADLLQRGGRYPPPRGASDIIGLEVSGTIERVGEDVTKWKINDRVCALLSGGGYAQRVSVPQGQLMAVPAEMTWAKAAGIPEAFITAYANVCVEGGIKQGQRVLIHGGSSGVGTSAIQLARSRGCSVACTVGNSMKADRCAQLGAECVVDYKQQDFLKVVEAWSGDDGINVILDIVGGDYLEKNLQLLAYEGRLIVIATTGGIKGSLNLGMLMKKRAHVVGSVLRSRSPLEKSKLIAEFGQEFGERISNNQIVPIIDSVYSFADVELAHRRMMSSEHVGKLILEW